ncbi:MAG: hypothetical protein HRU40_14620 [Saprospiraceae bacterium]|nr:hypothetical protein [Saprospiraceae bacterium]
MTVCIKTTYIIFPFFISLLLTGIVVLPCQAQTQKERNTLFAQLNYTDVLKVEIQTDTENLLEGDRFTDEYQAAKFMYKNQSGDDEVFEIKLRLRGRFRRKNCAIPPIKLNFDKDDLKERDWKKDDEIKLVTPCIDSPEGRDYIMREYIAYKIYQEMSPIHFRVQLIKLTLSDPNGKKKYKGWGILIEDDKTLAKRFDFERCEECYSIDADLFNKQSLEATAIFQYLIGNSDWSVILSKNIEILYQVDEKQDTTYYTVPYDFDFSGIVNPTYATPNYDYDLKSVRDRVYISPVGEESANSSIQLLLQKKQAIMEVVENFKLMNSISRQDVMEYIESCFDSLAEEGLKRPNRLIGN